MNNNNNDTTQKTPDVEPSLVAHPTPAPDDLNNDEAFQTFNQQLQTYIGADVQTLRNYVGYLENQIRENALAPLRQEWGDMFEDNFKRVRERFNTLPPHQQSIYDNVDGARFLWQQLQNEQDQTAAVPTFDRGKASAGPTTHKKYKYTQSEIIALSPKEYKQHAADIQAAYVSGLVDLNN